MFLAAVFMIAKTRKPHKRPLTDEWTKKMWYICTINYYLDSEQNFAICSNMGELGGQYAK